MEINRVYFYTASVLNWLPIFQFTSYRNIIYSALEYLVVNKRINLYAYVIMPNHIHLIWKPNTKNVQLSFMRFTAQKIKLKMIDQDAQLLSSFKVNKPDRQFQIWQRNPRAFELYQRRTCEQKLDYIHNNPVQGKWMLANDPTAYPHSSAAYYELGKENKLITHYREEF